MCIEHCVCILISTKEKNMKYSLLAGILIASFFSCSSVKESSAGKVSEDTNMVQDSLYSGKWLLTRIHPDGKTIEVTGKKAFIRFNREEGSAGGNGSCNSFGSTLKVNGNTLSIREIFSTKMYCEGMQDIEDSFLSQLAKATRYEIRGETLLLFEKDKLLLEFEKGEE